MKTASAVESTRKLLHTLWQRNLPVTQERISEMEQAASAAAKGHLTAEARSSAGSTAHKLAGSLGMFGYQHGTEIARELERTLELPGQVDATRLLELASALRAEIPV